MGPGDVMAFVALMTAMVLIFVLITSSYKRRIDFKLRSLELKAQASQRDERPEASENLRKLEQRVRVLERLATDRTPDLAAQIEALREEPAFELAKSDKEFN